MSSHVSEAPHRAPRPIAAWILGALSAAHAAGAFVFVGGARSPANELEGFVMGMTASVLLVGAIHSYDMVRPRAELRNATPLSR